MGKKIKTFLLGWTIDGMIRIIKDRGYVVCEADCTCEPKKEAKKK